MIIKSLIPHDIRIATTPYAISYYEPMHEYKVIKKYAYYPKSLWEFEDGTSVIHSMIPDDYRVFIKTNVMVWLDYYYEIQAYDRKSINPIRDRSKNTKRTYAVDQYYYLQKLL